jgi:DNA invertase Pin-like site-specific DNA recombinase
MSSGTPRSGRRAAAYIRMSTDHQKYSPENQSRVIGTYAAERNITIVRRYIDEGRSGLSIIGRNGLRELIDDVQIGTADFDCILVYDVSRWGRFQDIDESAYYEFICRRAGINVHYCADEFENDGSMASIIIKNVKRIAAADYSRQLSKRIFIAQCNMTEQGYWRGGAAVFGLRRTLLDEHGHPKMQLERGQQKSLHSERIVLTTGPQFEIDTVRRIFRLFVNEKKKITEIAAELNASQIRNALGNRWSKLTIDKMLANEAYIGNIVFNKNSYKLKTKAVSNPREMWVRHEGAFEGIIAPEIFAKAQKIIERRQYRLSNQEALDRLKALWRKKGHLSHKIISKAKRVPDGSTYRARFGSLTSTYQKIGFRPRPRYSWPETFARINLLSKELVNRIVSRLSARGIEASFATETHILSLGRNFLISIGTARALLEGGDGKMRWRVKVDRNARTDFTLIFRFDSSNQAIEDFRLVPTSHLARQHVKRLRITSRLFSNSTLFDNLDAVLSSLERLAKDHHGQSAEGQLLR